MKSFLLAIALATSAAAQTINIPIDASADRHRISPNVYGLNFATGTQLADLHVTLNRSGGNTTTRYNWQQNCANHARDWYYESLEHGPAVAGGETDDFVQETKGGGAEPMVTIPTIGWVAKMGPQRQRLSSFSIAKYGAQQSNDWEWFPDAGNGRKANGTLITGNDPNDASTLVDSAFMRQWVDHLVGKWGSSANGGVRYYVLDNEPSIWYDTHRDVHPTGPTMQEILSKMIDYGSAVRKADPNAIIAGPEEWGWSGYLLSGYDQQWGAQHNQWSNTPDRVANGGWDYLPFLMAKLYEYENGDGRKLVDVFTIHYYPQSDEYSDDVSNSMQLMRNRSTRSLWDANYVDESWIGTQVRLIPRMREWLDRWDPGTKLGITEYSWGADSHISGAIAQADVLGILGREGVDLATRWTTPDTGSAPYNAIKMYRSYDGAGSSFGDISIRATAPNPDNVAAFASLRTSDRALTIMLINKQLSSTATVLPQIANYTPSGAAQRWQMNAGGITHLSNVAAGASLVLPAQSVTLLVFPGTSDVTDPDATMNAPVFNQAMDQWSFSGTASDLNGITKVTYHVSGTKPQDGIATGTTNWSFGPIALQNGWNYVTVTAFDAAGNRRDVSRTVTQGVLGPSPDPPKRKRRVIG